MPGRCWSLEVVGSPWRHDFLQTHPGPLDSIVSPSEQRPSEWWKLPLSDVHNNMIRFQLSLTALTDDYCILPVLLQ